MSSKSATSTNNSSDNPNQNSASCAAGNRLSSSSHHVRHHSYDTTSNTLAAQIFPPSRSNRKENFHSKILPTRASHRHTSSYALDRSTLTELNSNHYHQHNYSASQDNLRRKLIKEKLVFEQKKMGKETKRKVKKRITKLK